MKTRRVLYADEGKILTNGTIHGKVIFLSENEYEFGYYEISEEEYREILRKQEEANSINV